MEHRSSQAGMPQRLKIIQHQAGHSYASTLAIYTNVSDEYRNRLLQRKLSARYAGLWQAEGEGDAP